MATALPVSERPIRQRILKFLLPIVLIIVTGVVFFLAQELAVLVISAYSALAHMNVSQTNNLLTSSITAQFFFVLLAEVFTVGLIFLILRLDGLNLVSIGLNKPRFKQIGWVLVAYPVYYFLLVISLIIFSHIFPSLNITQKQHIGFSSVHNGIQLTLTFISLVVLPPIAEEVLFRGFLFEGLKKGMPVVVAGLLVSAIFASAHLPEGGSKGPLYVAAIDTFCLSVVLVYLKQKTKSLWPGIYLHGLKNLIAFSLLYLYLPK